MRLVEKKDRKHTRSMRGCTVLARLSIIIEKWWYLIMLWQLFLADPDPLYQAKNWAAEHVCFGSNPCVRLAVWIWRLTFLLSFPVFWWTILASSWDFRFAQRHIADTRHSCNMAVEYKNARAPFTLHWCKTWKVTTMQQSWLELKNSTEAETICRAYKP